MEDTEKIKKYVRAANYLTVTQIYLQDNFLLERKLKSSDIKPKLFGHWGTCPGINFTYAHVNHLVKKHKQSTIFVLGPGHGFPGLQANLFLEETLGTVMFISNLATTLLFVRLTYFNKSTAVMLDNGIGV